MFAPANVFVKNINVVSEEKKKTPCMAWSMKTNFLIQMKWNISRTFGQELPLFAIILKAGIPAYGKQT